MLATKVGDTRGADVAERVQPGHMDFMYLGPIQTEMSQKQFSEQALAQGPYPGEKYNVWILLM